MPCKALCWILRVALLSIVPITYALPSTQSLNATSANSSFTLNDNFSCFPSRRRGSRRASTGDCLKAILGLPQNHQEGTFHSGGLGDGFRLPYTVFYQSCIVRVNIHPLSTDLSTWTSIGLVVGHLVNACAGGFASTGRYVKFFASLPICEIISQERTILSKIRHVFRKGFKW